MRTLRVNVADAWVAAAQVREAVHIEGKLLLYAARVASLAELAARELEVGHLARVGVGIRAGVRVGIRVGVRVGVSVSIRVRG